MSTKKDSEKYKSNKALFSVNELIDICFQYQLAGKGIDANVRVLAHNGLVPHQPVQVFKMPTHQRLLTMMQEADDCHIYITGDVFHFNACYQFTDYYPATRIYQIQIIDLKAVTKLGTYLQKNGIKLLPAKDAHLAPIIDVTGFSLRYQKFKDGWERKTAMFKGLADGRKKNTQIDHSIWLETPGCIVCGIEVEGMATSTLASDNGFMIGMRFCEVHASEALERTTLLEYVAKRWNLPEEVFAKFNYKFHEHNDFTVQLSAKAITSELDCKILEIRDQVITACRASGFILKLRLHSLSDYAYNILAPDGTKISRIDSANDHPDINYGPDHLHKKLTRKQKNKVESSFTTGFPVADIRAIRNLVEEAERQYGITFKA